METTTTNRKSTLWSVVAVGLLAAGLLLFFMIKNLSQGPKQTQGQKQQAASPKGGNAVPAQPRPDLGPGELSPLSQAIVKNDPAALTQALAAKPALAEPERATGEYAGLTPLQIAATLGNSEIVRALIDAGAPHDGATATGETPLMLAAARGRADIVGILADVGAQVDLKNGQGRTALMLAAAGGKAECVHALLNNGASVNVADQSGATALALAAETGAVDAMQPLTQAGANPDAADTQGVTPLMRAAKSAGPDAVILLLNAGASPQIKDGAGKTALDHAKTRTDEAGANVVAIITQAMG
jgi:hypothetical protein